MNFCLLLLIIGLRIPANVFKRFDKSIKNTYFVFVCLFVSGSLLRNIIILVMDNGWTANNNIIIP